MISVRKIIISTAICFLVLFVPQTVHAEIEKLPYLVTDGIQPKPSMMKNLARMFFNDTVSFDYESGKVLLSLSPKGTGNIYIGDTLYIYNMYLSRNYIYKATDDRCMTQQYNSVLDSIDITHLLRVGRNTLQIRIDDRCGRLRPISALYLTNIDKSNPDPRPFLDLPWDYRSKGLSFADAALSMTSFFDHEYPLLATGLDEPQDTSETIIKYNLNKRVQGSYSSHDGYDYARKGGALIGDSVLAAAAGWATYVNSCVACGNMIIVDHENGYQTRYLHLQREGLITSTPGEKKWIADRQAIGKVGATGNVIPSGDKGAHIHISVLKNNKVLDPFGWQVKDGSKDPWESYSGAKSSYLWKESLDATKSSVLMDGGTLRHGPYTITFPATAVDEPFVVTLESTPPPPLSPLLESIGSVINITASNYINEIITTFSDFWNINFTIPPNYLAKYKVGTISLYSSQDGLNWVRENTPVTVENNVLSAQSNHLSYFTFAAEKKDITPPITQAHILETQIKLTSQDDQDGLGLDYTLYKVAGQDWELYKEPILLDETARTIEFYSVDKSENIEDIKSIDYTPDNVTQEMKMQYDLDSFNILISDSNNSQTMIKKTSISKNGKVQKVQFINHNVTDFTFTMKEDKKTRFNQLYIDTIAYQNATPLKIERNYFAAKIVNADYPEYKKLLQVFEIKKKLKVRVEYSYKKDTTIVSIQAQGEPGQKELFNGLKTLKVIFNNGTLNYEL